MTVIEFEQSDLQAQMQAELTRLRDFRDEVFNLALSAQSWNSLRVCNSILNLAIDQKREVVGNVKGGVIDDGDTNR